MKNPWILIGIITVVLFGGAMWLSQSAEKQNNEGVTTMQHIKGNPEATVTLVEYSDFQCPACASFQPVLAEILEGYGDKISFEYKHYPLPIHNFSQQAAIAAEAAGQQGKFFEYHDALFQNQKQWAGSATPGAFFVQYAEDLGLNVEQFKTQMKSSILREKVRGDLKAAQELELTGTPTFFLNGERMEISTFEEFVTQIAVAVDPAAAAASSSTTAPADEAIKFGI